MIAIPPQDRSIQPSGIELLLDWIQALRQGDLKAVADLLDPHVVWHGLTGDLMCSGRAEVVEVIAGQMPLCLEVEALELISAPDHLVLGTRSRHLPDPPGAQLAGQVYNVLEHGSRRIFAIRDFAARHEALHAAGVGPEGRWR